MISKQHLAFLGAALLALIAAPAFLKTYGLYLLTLWLVYVIAALGLNLTVVSTPEHAAKVLADAEGGSTTGWARLPAP